MSRRGDNIWHRKDGRWEARYVKERVNGRAVYGYVYAKTYKEAKELQTAKIKEGENEKIEPCKLTMRSVFDMYLSNKKYSVKQSTYAKYQRDIANHLKPYWDNILLQDVNALKIEEFTEHLLSKGNIQTNEGLSAKTAKDIIVLLKSVILYAEQRKIGNISIPFISTPKIKTPTIQTLTRDEQKTLENYLWQDMDLPKMGVILTLYTGLRIGELCALQWRNIDMKNQTLCIDRTMQRINDSITTHSSRIVFDSPKSDSSIRNIPILNTLFDHLKNYFYTESYSESCFFLTGNNDFLEPRNLYRKYQSYLSECGLPHFTFHCLRHTFATRAIECGFDPKSLSEILGHSNVKITLDRYVHPNLELKKNHIELLSKVAQF